MDRLLFTILSLALAGGLWATEPQFRADDGNLWHQGDNPALAAASADLIALGAAADPREGRWDGAREVQLVSPLISFDYRWEPNNDSRLAMGTALGPWQGATLGYRTADVSLTSNHRVEHDFGLLYRPWSALSAAVTLENAFDPSRRWGAGLGLRPWALVGPGEDWLTLTADAAWVVDRPVLEQVGARLAWGPTDLRLWYDPAKNQPGVELTLSWGASETAASVGRLGQAVRWSTKPAPAPFLGTSVLRIQAGALRAAPPASSAFSWGGSGLSQPELVALLDRAAHAPEVKAVAFEGAPASGLASAEELRQALSRLRAAGKKVYVYGESFDDSLGFQGWIASADRLSLHPTGSLWLTSGGSRRLYLKDFLEKVGIRFVNFAPWETKSANNTLTFSSMPEAERSMLKRFLTDRDALALDALAAGRGERLKAPAADLVAQGPWLVAREALDRGLVDALETKAEYEASVLAAWPGANFVDDLPTRASRSWGQALGRKSIALVHLAGDIVLGPGRAGASIGTAAVEALSALRTDSSVAAIVLRVDSPGGAVTPSDSLAAEVKKAVAAGKPVVVLMGDLAASGGYYLSAPASRIFARPGTLTGSIGVTAAWFTGEKALELLGIKADGVDLGPSAAFGDWTRPLTERDAQKWNGMIEAVYDRFLDVVAEGRHLDKAKLEPLARGQIYTGREALALGLVDELGGQPEAQAWLEKTLDSPVEFFDVVPGENNAWADLLGPLARTALQATDSSALKMAEALDPVTAPLAQAWAGAAARGPGPLVWLDQP